MNENLQYVGQVEFPAPTGLGVNMMPFVMGDAESIPRECHGYLQLIKACGLEPDQFGKVGYLSIQESRVTADRPNHRRPGIHTEKHPASGWGGGWGKGHVNGRRLGGIYMASTIPDSCRAWDTHIEAPGTMGDCEHLRGNLDVGESILMQRNGLYWLTDSVPHESMPLMPGTFRQWFRLVTHEIDLWYKKHSTPNPFGVVPGCRIVDVNKFQ